MRNLIQNARKKNVRVTRSICQKKYSKLKELHLINREISNNQLP